MRDGITRRAGVRPTAIAGLAALCLCLPATASAEGEVTGPTPASLAAGKPAFAVTNTPSLIVLSIRLSRTSEINSVGELDGASGSEDGATIDVDNDVRPSTTVQGVDELMFAGRYFWQYAMRPVNPDGTTGDHFFSGVASFKLPAFARNLTMKAPYQDLRGTPVRRDRHRRDERQHGALRARDPAGLDGRRPQAPRRRAAQRRPRHLGVPRHEGAREQRRQAAEADGDGDGGGQQGLRLAHLHREVANHSHSATMPACCRAKRSQSRASGKVENFAMTVRAGRWINSDCPFMPSPA